MKTEYIVILEGTDDNTRFFIALVVLFFVLCINYAITRYNRNLPVDSDRKRSSIKPGSTWDHRDD